MTGENLARNALCARAAGCTQVGPRRFACGDGWQAASMLTHLCETDMGEWPEVEELARQVARTPEDVQRFIQNAIKFDREDGEVFRSPRVTLEGGIGDCDCQARLAALMTRAIGFPVRLAFLAGVVGNPKHVLAQAPHAPSTAARLSLGLGTPFSLDTRSWRWMETTLRARPDEHPVAAAVRLGADREDVSDFGRVVYTRPLAPAQSSIQYGRA